MKQAIPVALILFGSALFLLAGWTSIHPARGLWTDADARKLRQIERAVESLYARLTTPQKLRLEQRLADAKAGLRRADALPSFDARQNPGADATPGEAEKLTEVERAVVARDRLVRRRTRAMRSHKQTPIALRYGGLGCLVAGVASFFLLGRTRPREPTPAAAQPPKQ
ncbi:MAG: hypothetical protein AAFV43_15025 [Planctomycetota bacterium]